MSWKYSLLAWISDQFSLETTSDSKETTEFQTSKEIGSYVYDDITDFEACGFIKNTKI